MHKDMIKLKTALKFREKMQVEEIIVYKNGTADAMCPRCKTPLDREFISYCDNCGQRLSWNGFSYARSNVYLE